MGAPGRLIWLVSRAVGGGAIDWMGLCLSGSQGGEKRRSGRSWYAAVKVVRNPNPGGGCARSKNGGARAAITII